MFTASLFTLTVVPALWGTQVSADVWRPTIEGTNTPDRSEQGWVEDRGVISPTIPGTSTPDRSSDERYMQRGDTLYRVIPGTDTPDRSAPGWTRD